MKFELSKIVASLPQLLIAAGLVCALSACKAEVGSEKWCKNLKAELDKELTLDGAKQYAKHCLLD